jgi:phosphoserine phosphatase
MLMRALAQSHTNIAISGSPRVAVEAFLADLPLTQVYGSEFEIEDDVFTGAARSVGDKAVILRNLTEQGTVTQQGSIALGDTVGDTSALEHADHPVMFNPSRTLANYGQEFGWDQVIEVKDRILVMRLDAQTSRYTAADIEDFIDDLQAGSQ